MAIQLDGTTGISTSGNITAAGTLTVGTFVPTSLSASGNVTGGNLNTAGALSVGGNSVITGDLTVVGNASLSGNIIGDKITNGSTSVEIPVANGNVSFTIGGSTNVVVVTTTGGFVTGVVSATGNITGSNLNASGLSLASNVLSALNSTFAITTSANVSANNVIATNHINASGDISGANLTSSGSMSAIGNATAGNILTPGVLSSAGNITGGNIVTIGLISSVGNITSNNILTGGLISATGNITAGNVLGGANVNATSLTGTTVSVSANITGGNLLTGGLISATGTITGSTLTGSVVSASGNVIAGNLVNSSGNSVVEFFNTGTVSANIVLFQQGANGNVTIRVGESTTEAPGNFGLYSSGQIGASGNLISLSNISATGNVISGNLNAAGLSLSSNVVSALNSTSNITTTANIAGGYFLGNGSLLTGIDATSIQNGTSNVRVVSSGGNVAIGVGGTSNVAVYATTGEYVTGLISATGNITGDNLNAAGLSLSSNVISALNSTSNITTTANIAGSYILGNGSLLTGIDATSIQNGNSNVRVVSSGGNVAIGVGGTSNVVVYATTGEYVTGLISATGNITGGNILGGANVNATTHTGTTVSVTGNITGGNANIGGSLNVTSLLTVDGGTYGNVVTTPFASVYATGAGPNPYAIMQVRSNDGISGMGMQAYANLNGLLYSNTGITFQTGATVRDKDYPTGGVSRVIIDSTGLTANGIVSASGNVTGGNILTGGLISATGNVTGGNVISNTVVGTGLTLISTGDLTLSTTGNINANNEYINNVPQPQQNADAANKQYVDNLVSTAISYHSPVIAATISNLDTATGGTITYAQPNGVANGVGATLTTTGSFNLIDTANIQTIGTRVLVKDEGNAVFNGVYTWANATVIVRATDADTYGAGNPTQLGINDYFFVESGNVNAGAAYIVNAPSGTITFGTSNITFAEFSKAQIYSANTSAGISLAGTVINALVDNVTTAFSTGNIVVKASAQLTTPNIGAATGTSLSATGNITAGNIVGGANVNATLFTGNTVSITANVTGGNILTGGLISSTGNVNTPRVIVGSNVALGGAAFEAWEAEPAFTVGAIFAGGVTRNFGNASFLSYYVANQVITGFSGTYVLFFDSAGSSTITVTPQTGEISSTGNVSGGNLYTFGNIQGSNVLFGTGNVSGSGNIIGGNVLFDSGIVSGTGNITAGNVNATLNGSGSNVTSISANNISSGTLAQARLANAAVTLGSTTLTLGSTVTTVAGLTSVTSTTFVGALTGAATSATTAATVTTAAQPNITSVGTLSGLTINNATTAITNGATAGTGNIGASGAGFNTIFAKATSAQYADLAESYAADAKYVAGTVLTFGGSYEVTLANESNDVRVAGIVSTNPAHVMNASLDAEHVAVVALTGRVPTSVVGTVRKGDMMVSAGNGAAQACATPAMGTVIGKALENFNGKSGTIEIVVGRL